MEFLYEYGLFFAKVLTFLVAFVVIVSLVGASAMRSQKNDPGHLEVTKLNQRFDDLFQGLRHAVLEPKDLKKQDKAEKKAEKAKQKSKSKDDTKETESDKRVFVLDFDGDVKASDTDNLREIVTAILSIARESDEVVVRLESQGGMVHSYGLAASQLARITQKSIPLTVCVDKVAASGGYMMACVGTKILAAPFAILGSIGVIAQLPNFHRLLKKNNVDYEMITAGEYKRTLTMFGENTPKGRQKFLEDIEDTHGLFKDFIRSHRDKVDIETVATGEVWFGTRALEHALVDGVMTSDEYLFGLRDEADIFLVDFVRKETLPEKLGISISTAVDRVWNMFYQKAVARFWS